MSRLQHIATFSRRVLFLSVVAAYCAGCNLDRLPFPGIERPPQVPNDATVEQIVHVLNINTLGTQTQPGLNSWHATNASVTLSNIGVPAPATIAVEAPHYLRIKVQNPLPPRNNLFDMGSNSEEFWVWAKSDQPSGILHVRHEEVDVISRYFDLPLHPDWMMEVFGVVPLDPADYRKEESDAGRNYVELVAQKTAPNGMRVHDVIRVDTHRGVIVRRALHAEDGSVLGVAEFSDHERDTQSQLMLPREIRLEVPAMEATVTFHLKNVQLNPPPMSARYWQPPQIEGERDIQMINWLPPEALHSAPIQPAGGTGPSSPFYPTTEAPLDADDVGSASLNSGGNIGSALQPYAWGGSTPTGIPDDANGDTGLPSSRANETGRATLGNPGSYDDAPLWGQDAASDASSYVPAASPSADTGRTRFEPTPPPSNIPIWAQP